MSGETMRDRIAMAALPAVVAACARDTLAERESFEQMFARKAYALADAMLAARGGDAPQGAGDAVKRQMLAALREARDELMQAGFSDPNNMRHTAIVFRRICAAIAAAEQEQSA